MRDSISVMVLSIAAAMVAVGCGDDDRMGIDGGPIRDSGPSMDGPVNDSGPGPDAGSMEDGGPAVDGGGGTDGGPTGIPVELTETCPKFTACGGDLEGVWAYSGACVTVADAEAMFAAACPTADILMGSGTVDGTVTFSATMISREVTTTLDVTVNVPTECTMGFGCLLVGPVIESMAMLDDVTCVDAASGRSGCDCRILNSAPVSENDAYTTIGGNTFENSRTMRRWEYCNDGSGGLSVREVMGGDGGDPIEPGVQSFTAVK
jgi:hypothetical protein